MTIPESLPQTFGELVAALAGAWIGISVSLAVYRLWLSPLAKIPGPKLAAATGWYEFWYDCVRVGRFSFEIDRIHEVYGPIVRISPNEVHIRDSQFFLDIHSNSQKLDKYAFFYHFLASPDAAFATTSSDIHQKRRAALAKHFSMSNVLRLEPLIHQCLAKLFLRLEEHRWAGKPVELSNAYRCFASDVITEYAFPRSKHLLDFPDFAADGNRNLRDLLVIAHWNRHIPFLIPLLNAVPRWLVAATSPDSTLAVFDTQQFLKDTAAAVVSQTPHLANEHLSKPSVLHQIYSSSLPTSEKSLSRLTQEAQTLLGAGTETTANTLILTTYHLLASPPALHRLKAELATLTPDPTATNKTLLTYTHLAKLSYLTAVINEGLRLSSSVPGRLPRLNPSDPITYASFSLPPGTAVSTSIRDVHSDPRIFPDPEKFIPERWLVAPEERALLERWLVPFGRGPRSCVGRELAMVEVGCVVGNLFARFGGGEGEGEREGRGEGGMGLRLWETEEGDVSMVHDLLTPFPAWRSGGLRVLVG